MAEYIQANLVVLSKEKNSSTKNCIHPKIYQVPLPAPIIQLQKDVNLEWDLLFVNGMPFLTLQIH